MGRQKVMFFILAISPWILFAEETKKETDDVIIPEVVVVKKTTKKSILGKIRALMYGRHRSEPESQYERSAIYEKKPSANEVARQSEIFKQKMSQNIKDKNTKQRLTADKYIEKEIKKITKEKTQESKKDKIDTKINPPLFIDNTSIVTPANIVYIPHEKKILTAEQIKAIHARKRDGR